MVNSSDTILVFTIAKLVDGGIRDSLFYADIEVFRAKSWQRYKVMNTRIMLER